MFFTQNFRYSWAFIFVINILFSPALFSQTFTKLFDFEEADGSRSHSKLISDGTYFYGMTNRGGTNDGGTIFKIKIDGSEFQKLHDFDGLNGYQPYNSLTLVGSELFGVTFQGGLNNEGILFKINTDGNGFSKLIDFQNGNNGKLPQSSLLFDGTYLIGTTYSGGDAGGGSIYKIKPDGTSFSIVHEFTGGGGTHSINGSQPQNDLLFDGTYLYGVTFNGGDGGNGTIYKIKTDGTDFVKLHDFTDNHNNTNVSSAGVILYEDYLYGNTFLGEDDDNGFIYKIKTDGTGFEVLHNFTYETGTKPAGELTIYNGYLYGTTSSSKGIFRIKPDGTDFSVVYNFNNNSGYAPRAGLIKFENSLYGLTTSGGNYGYGTVYKYDDETLSSNSDLYKSQIKIYPNPAQNQLFIELSSTNSPTKYVIYDQIGKKVGIGNIISNQQTVDVSTLKPGIYFIEIGKVTHKIIKK